MKKTLLALVTVALLAPPAFSSVSLRNGNFFIGYNDLMYPGGFEPKIERVYNSKTDYDKGIFGVGWGFEYEVYIRVAADGSVVVHEYGGGAENRFTPAAFSQTDLDKAVDMIAQAAKQTGTISSAEQLTEYKKKLTGNPDYRNSEWDRLRAAGKLQSRVLPEGAKLISNRYSYQFITRVADGYIRTFETGRIEKFNDTGRLVKVSDKNGNFVEFSYNREGKLEKMVDNQGRHMLFSFNEHGRVSKVEGDGGKKAVYEYDSKDLLVKSTDSEGNVYTYKYDLTKTKNLIPPLTEIGYSDKTSQKIAYWNDDFQNVKSVKDREGVFTEYSYKNDPKDPGYTAVTVTVHASDQLTDKNGKAIAPISVSKYEYYFKKKATGEEWQYKLVTTMDGDRTETTYNECCGLPLIIKHGGAETSFEYDTKGHVVKKITPNEVTELAYDPQAGKVSKVVRYSKTSKKNVTWSEFQYDSRGNLKFAKNSAKKGVRLFYDGNGRISSMVDQDRRQINFKYNENSKPIEITDPKVGTITVSYKQTGEIAKVESTAGRKIALQVTSAFQNLLDIIKPAGVSLSF